MTPKKTGFSFGVVLGAIIGTGAIVLSQSKEGKVIRKKVLEELDNLKETYPEQAEKLESVVSSALDEAKSLTQEIRQNSFSNAKPQTKRKVKKPKRQFVRSGS